MSNELAFIIELRKITKISFMYAQSAFYTLSDADREKPLEAAKRYKERFKL